MSGLESASIAAVASRASASASACSTAALSVPAAPAVASTSPPLDQREQRKFEQELARIDAMERKEEQAKIRLQQQQQQQHPSPSSRGKSLAAPSVSANSSPAASPRKSSRMASQTHRSSGGGGEADEAEEAALRSRSHVPGPSPATPALPSPLPAGFRHVRRHGVHGAHSLQPAWHTRALAALPLCPVLRPSWAEFADAAAYLRSVSERYSEHVGAVQIVPPKGWAMSYAYDLEAQAPCSRRGSHSDCPATHAAANSASATAAAAHSSAIAGSNGAEHSASASARPLRFEVREQVMHKPLMQRWMAEATESDALSMPTIADADAEPTPALIAAHAPDGTFAPPAPTLLQFHATAALSLQLLSRPYKNMSLRAFTNEAKTAASHWSTRERQLHASLATMRAKEKAARDAASSAASDTAASSRVSAGAGSAAGDDDLAQLLASDPRLAAEVSYWEWIFAQDKPRTVYATDVEVRQEFRCARWFERSHAGEKAEATASSAAASSHEPPVPVWACQVSAMRAIVLEYGKLDACKRREVEERAMRHRPAATLQQQQSPSGLPSCPFCASPSCKLQQAPTAWDMDMLAWLPGGVLKHLGASAPGITSPMLYVGSAHSTFPVHNEDDYAYSCSYMHPLEGDEGGQMPPRKVQAQAEAQHGQRNDDDEEDAHAAQHASAAPRSSQKVWYTVAGRHSAALEALVEEQLLPGYNSHERALSLLPRKSTLLSPALVSRAGIPVHKLYHTPGTFVVTFPQAYHWGHSCGTAGVQTTASGGQGVVGSGYNVTESVNFLLEDWLLDGEGRSSTDDRCPLNKIIAPGMPAPTPAASPSFPAMSVASSAACWNSGCGLKASRIYRLLHQQAVLPHEQLVLNMARAAIHVAKVQRSQVIVRVKFARHAKRRRSVTEADARSQTNASPTPTTLAPLPPCAELQVPFLRRVAAELHALIADEKRARLALRHSVSPPIMLVGSTIDSMRTPASKHHHSLAADAFMLDEPFEEAEGSSTLQEKEVDAAWEWEDAASSAKSPSLVDPQAVRLTQRCMTARQRMGEEAVDESETLRTESPQANPLVPSNLLNTVHCAICRAPCTLAYVDCPCDEYIRRWRNTETTPPTIRVSCIRHPASICPCGRAMVTWLYSMRELSELEEQLQTVLVMRVAEEAEKLEAEQQQQQQRHRLADDNKEGFERNGAHEPAAASEPLHVKSEPLESAVSMEISASADALSNASVSTPANAVATVTLGADLTTVSPPVYGPLSVRSTEPPHLPSSPTCAPTIPAVACVKEEDAPLPNLPCASMHDSQSDVACGATPFSAPHSPDVGSCAATSVVLGQSTPSVRTVSPDVPMAGQKRPAELELPSSFLQTITQSCEAGAAMKKQRVHSPPSVLPMPAQLLALQQQQQERQRLQQLDLMHQEKLLKELQAQLAQQQTQMMQAHAKSHAHMLQAQQQEQQHQQRQHQQHAHHVQQQSPHHPQQRAPQDPWSPEPSWPHAPVRQQSRPPPVPATIQSGAVEQPAHNSLRQQHSQQQLQQYKMQVHAQQQQPPSWSPHMLLDSSAHQQAQQQQLHQQHRWNSHASNLLPTPSPPVASLSVMTGVGAGTHSAVHSFGHTSELQPTQPHVAQHQMIEPAADIYLQLQQSRQREALLADQLRRLNEPASASMHQSMQSVPAAVHASGLSGDAYARAPLSLPPFIDSSVARAVEQSLEAEIARLQQRLVVEQEHERLMQQQQEQQQRQQRERQQLLLQQQQQSSLSMQLLPSSHLQSPAPPLPITLPADVSTEHLQWLQHQVSLQLQLRTMQAHTGASHAQMGAHVAGSGAASLASYTQSRH